MSSCSILVLCFKRLAAIDHIDFIDDRVFKLLRRDGPLERRGELIAQLGRTATLERDDLVVFQLAVRW